MTLKSCSTRRETPPWCSVSAVFQAIAIIWQLHAGPLRFGALRRGVVGISEKVLAEQLRELQFAGVVRRHDFGEVPPRVEYSLTLTGAELNEAVHALAQLGQRHAMTDAGQAECDGLLA